MARMTKKRLFIAAISMVTSGSLAQGQGNDGESRTPGISEAFNVVKHGAVGDGVTVNTKAFAKTILACAEAGGGTVLVPPGVYLSGPIRLHSNMTLHVEAGATIQASPRLDDYLEEGDGAWGEGSGESLRAGLITARDATRVAITGRGIIDGNALAFHNPNELHGRIDKCFARQGQDYMDPKYGTQHGPIAHGERPGNLVRFFHCRNVLLRSVTIQNSPSWTAQFNQCENVNVLGVSINSHESDCRIPNDDGIDIFNSQRVHISDCDIQTGDDCIAIFGGQAVTVVNCTLASHSSGIRVGYIGGDIRDCTYKNLVIHSNRGISLFVRGEDSIDNVCFSDIIIRSRLVTGHWWGQAEPIHISAVPWDENATALGTISNVRFSNILAESESGIVVHGSESSLIRNLSLESVHLKLKDGPLQSSYGGNFDLRAARDVTKRVFAHDIPALYCRYAEGLRIKGVRVAWDEPMPEFFNHALQLEDVRDVVIDGFDGRQPHPEGEVVMLNRVAGVSIRGCKAAEGTDTFVRGVDITDGRLFTNNDLREARTFYLPSDVGFLMGDNLLPSGSRQNR
jgi:polygalacturonase